MSWASARNGRYIAWNNRRVEEKIIFDLLELTSEALVSEGDTSTSPLALTPWPTSADVQFAGLLSFVPAGETVH